MTTVLRTLVAVVLFALAAAAYSTAGPLFHLHKVTLAGEGAWLLRPETVRAGLQESGKMSLVFGDFAALARHLETSPLIRSATIAKKYPNEIVVTVASRQPVARSATGGLVDSNGQWYQASTNAVLPIFAVDRRLLPQAVALHDDVVAELAAIDLGVNQLRHDGQGWLLFLSNGWILQLGQRKMRTRVQRFVENWPQLHRELAGATNLRFDLRYPRGMAVAGLVEISTEENTDGET